MCRFTEAVCILDGEPERIDYHNERLNRTRRAFFPECGDIDLEKALGEWVPFAADGTAVKGKYKCRIEYDIAIRDVTVTPYIPRKITAIRLVYDDGLDYAYKYADRTCFDALSKNTGPHEAALIVKNGLITDTSFSNVALYDGNEWVVPTSYLLPGTMRRYLIDSGMVREVKVTPRDLSSYERISLINAMLSLGDSVVPVSSILLEDEGITGYYIGMKHTYNNIISFVWTTNIERSLRFYTEILGFKKGFASDDWIELAIPGLHTGYIALNRWTLDKPIATNDFITLGVESLGDFKKHLVASNVQLKGETTEFYEEGIKMLKFFDPDGNTLTAAEVEPI